MFEILRSYTRPTGRMMDVALYGLGFTLAMGRLYSWYGSGISICFVIPTSLCMSQPEGRKKEPNGGICEFMVLGGYVARLEWVLLVGFFSSVIAGWACKKIPRIVRGCNIIIRSSKNPRVCVVCILFYVS